MMVPSAHAQMADLPELLRQAQILIIKILNVFLRLHVVKRQRYIFAFLELDPISSFGDGHYTNLISQALVRFPL